MPAPRHVFFRFLCLLLYFHTSLASRAEKYLDDEQSDRLTSTSLREGALFPLGDPSAPYRLVRRLSPKMPKEESEASLLEMVPANDNVRAQLPAFTVDRHLGTGGFGDTWLATDQRTNRPVAIKFFYHGSPDNVESYYNQHDYKEHSVKVDEAVTECKFANELIATAEQGCYLGSRSITACLEEHAQVDTFHPDDEFPLYIVLEHGGESLDQWINKQRAQGPAPNHIMKARAIMKGILRGIEAMSAQGKIHHDLKTPNTVVSEEADGIPIVKLIDFGGVIDTQTVPKIPCDGCPFHTSTREYAPPEYHQGRDYEDPPYSYDIWAAGLIYMEVVCPPMPWTAHQVASESITIEWITQTLTSYGCYSHDADPHGQQADQYDVRIMMEMLQLDPTKRSGPTHILAYESMMTAGFHGEAYRQGEQVEYCSKTKRKWMKATIQQVWADGIYSIDLKANQYVEHDTLRKESPEESPWIKAFFDTLVEKIGNVNWVWDHVAPDGVMSLEGWKQFCIKYNADYQWELSDWHYIELYKAVTRTVGAMSEGDFKARFR